MTTAADAGARGLQVVAVMGATATGKTALAVELARRLGGELVNADSRQAIAELSVGTCKPTERELRGVACHGLDWAHLGAPFTVADFCAQATPCVEQILGRGQLAIVVGGSGLYVRSLLRGFDFGVVGPPPLAPPRGGRGGGSLARDLADLDRLRSGPVPGLDRRNPRRVRRALELARAGAVAGLRDPGWRVSELACGLGPGPLRARIEARAERLLGPPLMAEVLSLRAEGRRAEELSGAAIGYAEALDWIEGRCSRAEALRRLVQRTWQYARAQLTWLRREPGLVWLDAGGSYQELLGRALQSLDQQAAAVAP